MLVRIFILLGVVGVSRLLGGESAVRSKDTARPPRTPKRKGNALWDGRIHS